MGEYDGSDGMIVVEGKTAKDTAAVKDCPEPVQTNKRAEMSSQRGVWYEVDKEWSKVKVRVKVRVKVKG